MKPRKNQNGSGSHPLTGAYGTRDTVTTTSPRNPMAGLEGYAPSYFNSGREYFNESNLSQNPDGTYSPIVDGRESRHSFDTGYNDEMIQMQRETDELLAELLKQPPVNTGGGSRYGNMQKMLDGLIATGLLTQGSQQYATPEKMQYMDFDPLRQNVESMKGTTLEQIAQAFAPLQALSQPLQTSSGQVSPAATGISPEVAGLAQAMGIGDDYDAQVANANQDILAGAAEFLGANQLVDRAFNERRKGVSDVGALTQGLLQAQAERDAMLALAGLDMSEMQDVRNVDASNVTANNEVAMRNTDLANADRQQVIQMLLSLIGESAGMGQTLDLSGMVV